MSNLNCVNEIRMKSHDHNSLKREWNTTYAISVGKKYNNGENDKKNQGNSNNNLVLPHLSLRLTKKFKDIFRTISIMKEMVCYL
jgi:hypothetical protein